jgi:predicted nucleic acid-binding protein
VEHPGSLVILDDRRGRLVASSLGLTMIGTLGILVVPLNFRDEFTPC